MPRLLSLATVIIFMSTLAFAGDPPVKPEPKVEPKKTDLIYRWDLLEGKTAIYDVELVSYVAVERKTEGLLSSDEEDAKTEGKTTTKMRLSMTFAKGERERGRVTVSTSRLMVSVAQTQMGKTETVSYDSGNPPKAGVPDQLKATVTALLGNPYTLIVSRRGVVESVEGRQRSELETLKSAFLVLPEMPRAEGEGWTRIARQDLDPLGETVTKVSYKLSKVAEPANGNQGERRVDLEIKTELDDRLSRIPGTTTAKIENAKGTGHVTLDVRGLKQEEDTSSSYELVVKQVTPPVEQHNRLESTSHWKLVELKDAEKK